MVLFFYSSRRRHTRWPRDWSSDVCSSDLSNDDLDLHRPFVDKLTWPAPEHVGGTMRRVPDLIDVWFDSGAMPVAQWHYPRSEERRVGKECRSGVAAYAWR